MLEGVYRNLLLEIIKKLLTNPITNMNISINKHTELSGKFQILSKNCQRYMNSSIEYPLLKISEYGVFSGLYFPVFVLNVEIYSAYFRIQSEQGEIRTKKAPHLNTFEAMIMITENYISLNKALLTYNAIQNIPLSPLNTRHKLKVHTTFRRRDGRLLNIS